jgi:hypothetical protein
VDRNGDDEDVRRDINNKGGKCEVEAMGSGEGLNKCRHEPEAMGKEMGKLMHKDTNSSPVAELRR